uniref:Uncharacterized protein n=1 Tax=Arundo donax TaxID=35708 RepID=A0A0A8ZKC4_ARUDO
MKTALLQNFIPYSLCLDLSYACICIPLP